MGQAATPTDGLAEKISRHHQRTGRPFVTLTYAQSLDGSIAARRDQRLVLSGDESSLMTHQLRAAHDAILIGIGTLLADDPRLTARKVGGPNPQPVIVDSHLRFPLTARLLEHPDRKPWIITSQAIDPSHRMGLEDKGARIFLVPSLADDRLDLGAMMMALGAQGITSLMVEGGARIITSFLMAQLADFLVVTIAPVFVGGVRAVEASETPSSFPAMSDVQSAQFGRDVVVWGELGRTA